MKAFPLQLRNAINDESSMMDVGQVLNAIYGSNNNNPTMRMQRQPIAKHRFRYRTDGVRYLEKSRRDPMSIHVVSRLHYLYFLFYYNFYFSYLY